MPRFKNCKFQDCIYKNTNFQGSRFEDCEFSGVMESGHFNGHANEDFYLGIWPFKINPKDYPNKMINVDFSKAEIKDFGFINSLDLSKATFPDSENLLVVKDYRNVIAQLEIEVNKMTNSKLSKQILNT